MNHRLRFTILIISTVALVVTMAVSTAGCRGNLDTFTRDDDFLTTGRTLSFFNAIQVDPPSEDSAGPQFVTDADLNGDGLTDLVSAWNQSQPVQIHLQRRSAAGDISFETVTLAGNIPAVSVAGIEMADFDQDGAIDIAVLIKISLLADAGCIDSELPDEGTLSGLVVLYMGPADPAQANQALAWDELILEASRLPAPDTAPAVPENEGYTDMEIGDINLDGLPDIILASNSSCGGQAADILLFTNTGPANVRDRTWQAQVLPNPFPRTTIKSIELGDVDGDGDLDIVATFPDAPSMNIRWLRNPTVDTPDDFHISDGLWQVGTVAQIATGADVIELADLDRDGLLDVIVRSTAGGLIQWLKGPTGPTTAPLRAIPWQVFTVAEFTERVPEGLAVGDLNGDGQMEIIATAQGGLIWFDSQGPPTVFDQWSEVLIIDDRSAGATDADPATTDPSVEPGAVAGDTLINSVRAVDIDGDGAMDIIATLDRSGLSGLTNDALVWFRNNGGS